MSQTTQISPSAENTSAEAAPSLLWQVHLARRNPQRLPVLVLILLLGSSCIWMMFHQALPVLAAVLLLLGASTDFLFPLRYRITAEGVYADSLTSRMHLPWKEARRSLLERGAVTLTPLAVPSRLDAFRGITLRFARKGEQGDRASVLEAIRQYAPAVLPVPTEDEAAPPTAVTATLETER